MFDESNDPMPAGEPFGSRQPSGSRHPPGDQASQHPEMPTDPPAEPPPETRIVVIEPEVTFSTRQSGGRTSYVAHHGVLGQYFRLGVEEYHVAVLLDGSRSVSDVHRQIHEDGLLWSAEDVAGLAAELVKQKLASVHTIANSDGLGAGHDPSQASGGQADQNPGSDASGMAAPVSAGNSPTPPGPPGTPAPSASRLQNIMRMMSLTISQRFPLFNGHTLAAKVNPILGPAFTRTGLIIWSLLVGSGLLVVFGHHDQFSHEIRRLFDPGIWLVLLVFWLLAKLLHELGHAVCAYRHEVRVGKTGVMFFLFAPLAYVDVTDAWRIESRYKRVQIALAGVYLELGVAGIAAWAWWFLPDGTLRHYAAQIFLVTGPATLLVNANPLLRLDGYYVLSDLLEIPNLRMHGRAQLSKRIERMLFGIPIDTPRLFGWRRPAATLHAFCSVVFQLFWMGGLVFAVALWAKGLGIAIAIIAGLLWAVIPLVRWVCKIWSIAPGERFGLNPFRTRLIGLALLVFTLLQQISFSTSPFDRRVSVVVRYKDEQIARASADAFVTAVHVQRGDRVQPGMLLLELDQPALLVKRDQKNDDILLAEQRAIQMRQRGDLAQSAAETEQAESLKRQLAEIDAQIAGLRVLAQRDGVVTSSDPQRLLGVYAKVGTELVRVSDPREMELLAVVGKDDMAAYQCAVMSQLVSSVRLRGGTTFQAKPAALLPRAIESLPHPALSASVGGPVAVEPSANGDGKMKMIQPHGESNTTLDAVTSLSVKSGQIGTMTICDDRSLLTRVYDDLIASSTPPQ